MQPLSDKAVKVFKAQRRFNPFGKYVFLYKDAPLVSNTINHHLMRIYELADVEYMSSHKIRFWSVTNMYANGMQQAKIQRMYPSCTPCCSPCETGCGCPVDTSAKQKHRPSRQARPRTFEARMGYALDGIKETSRFLIASSINQAGRRSIICASHGCVVANKFLPLKWVPPICISSRLD